MFMEVVKLKANGKIKINKSIEIAMKLK